MRIRSVPRFSWMLVCVLLALPASAHTLWSLDVSPSDVVGGSPATATVRLSDEAPAGGIVLKLASSNAAASVPATVTVPAGARRVTFTISTSVVSSNAKATISATGPYNTVADSLTVEPPPPVLFSFTVSPPVGPVGTAFTGTVTLDKEPPHGGAVVRLSSDNPDVRVPHDVKVEDHKTTDTFPIDTSHVEWSATATITATYNGVTMTAVLTIPCTLGRVPPPRSFPSTDQVWIDWDSAPSRVKASDWIPDPNQSANSGSGSFATGVGPGEHGFSAYTGLDQGLHIREGDWLVLYALIDPCNPPQELMVGFIDDLSNVEKVAYWGANLITDFGKGRNLKYMGQLPKADGNDGCNDGHGYGAGYGQGKDQPEWVRLEIKASTLGLEGRTVQGLVIKLWDGRVWVDRIGRSPTCTTPIARAPSSFKPGDVVWIDDTFPNDITTSDNWSPWFWDNQQSASGTFSFTMLPRIELQATLYENQVFTNSGSAFGDAIPAGNNIVLYTLIDPCDPPQEILLQFRDSSGVLSWDHGAYWGDNLISGPDIGVLSPKNMGELPRAGNWVRLEIPASSVGMGSQGLTGFHIYIFGGKVWFDRMGMSPATTQTTHH